MINSINRDVGYTLYKTLNITVNVNTLTLMSYYPHSHVFPKSNKVKKMSEILIQLCAMKQGITPRTKSTLQYAVL